MLAGLHWQLLIHQAAVWGRHPKCGVLILTMPLRKQDTTRRGAQESRGHCPSRRLVTRNNTDSDSGSLALSFPEKDGEQWPGSQVSIW